MKSSRLSKRILSFALAITMMMGLMPTLNFRAAAADVQKDLIYDFTALWSKEHADAATDYVKTITYADTTGLETEPWAFFSTTATGNNSYFRYLNTAYHSIVMHHENTGQLKIKVPVAGKYIPKVAMNGETNIATLAQLFKLNAAGDAIEGAAIAESEILVRGTADYAIGTGAIELAKGEYVVSIKTTNDGHASAIDGFKLLVPSAKPDIVVNMDSANGLINMKAGGTAKIPLNISLSEGTIDLAGISINTTFSTADIASATPENTESGAAVTFTALAAGTTTAEVTVTKDGANAGSAKVNIVVAAKDAPEPAAANLVYDFKKAWVGDISGPYVEKIGYAMTTTGAIGELNIATVSAPWAFHSSTVAKEGGYFKYNSKDYGLALYQPNTANLKFKVPATGMYMPKVTIFKATGADSSYKISRLEANGTIGEVVSETSANIKKPATDETKDYEISDKPIKLTAGEYVLSITHAVRRELVFIDAFKLDVVASATLNMTAEATANTKVEGTVDVPLTLSMSNGSAVDYTALVIDTTFDPIDVASAVASKDTASAKVTFTGLKKGTTNATIKATIGDITASVPVSITVADKDAPPVTVARNSYYDFKKAFNSSDKTNTYFDTITYEMTTGNTLNPSITSDAWAFSSRSETTAAAGNYLKYNGDGYGLAMYGSDGKGKTYEGTVKFKVPASGSYLPRIAVFGTDDAAFTTYTIKAFDGTVLATKNINNANYATAGEVSIADAPIAFDAAKEYTLSIKNTGGLSLTDGLRLALADTPVITDVALANNEGLVTLKVGETVSCPIAVTLSDKSVADNNTLTINATPSVAGKATLAPSGAALKITGDAVGKTTATVLVNNGKAALSRKININVIAADTPAPVSHDLTYNFKKCAIRWQYAKDFAPTINYSATTKGASGEIQGKIASDPWAYDSQDTSDGGMFRYASTDYGFQLYAVGSATIKIKVPVASKYQPKINMFTATGTDITISLMQGKTVKATAVVAKGTSGWSNIGTPIDLAAGEYTIKMEIKAKESAFIDGFQLVDKNGVAELSVDASAAGGLITIPVGASVDLPLGLKMSDDAKIDYANVTVGATLDPTGIATAVGSKTDAAAKVTFTAAKEGKTTATVTVANGDITGSAKVNINVVPAGGQKIYDLTYDFQKGWNDNLTMEYVKTINYAMTTTGAFGELNPSMPSEPWAFYSTTAEGGNNYFKYNTKDYGLALSYASAGSVKIKVPVSGGYQPFVTLHEATNAPVTIVINKYNSATGELGAEVVKKLDIVANGTKDYAIADDQVQFDAGEYVVTMSHSGRRGLAVYNAIKLVNLDTKYKVTAAPISVIKGQTATSAITVTDYMGAPIDAKILTNELTLSNDKLATTTVKTVGGKLALEVVAGDKIGKYVATVKVKSADGKFGQVDIPVSVTSDFDTDVRITMPDKVKLSEDVSVPVTVKYIRAGATTDEDAPATITVKPSDTSILKASVIEGSGKISNSIKLSGLKTGSCALEVKVAVDDVVKTLHYPIMVYKTDGLSTNNYSFMIHLGMPTGMDVSAVDSFLGTIINSGSQLRPGAVTDTWCYAGQGENTRMFRNQYDSYGSSMEDGTGTYGAIKVRLPESGIYQLVSQNALYPMAGVMRVYVAPANAENPRDPKYSVGSKDTFIPGDKNVIINIHFTNMRTIALDAGDYIVTWENIGKTPGVISPTSRLYIGGMKLVAKTELPKVSVIAPAVPDVKQYNKVEVPLTATVSDESDEDLVGADIKITPKQSGIVDAKTIVRDNKVYLQVTGVGVGSTSLKLDVNIAGVPRATVDVPVKCLEAGKFDKLFAGIVGSELNTITLHKMNPDLNQVDFAVKFFDDSGEEISKESADIQKATVTYSCDDTDVLTIDAKSGHVMAKTPGKATVHVSATMSGITKTVDVEVNVTFGKTQSSFYTPEKVENARENAKNYGWAASAKKTAIANAEKYLNKQELLWDSVTTQELPRSYYTGYRGDPDAAKCRQCGVNIDAEFGIDYGWIRNPLESPWKLQCPACRRKFPTNDFGSFYKLGIDEHGKWNYELAKQKNAELVAQGKPGFLVNLDSAGELGADWGVDDGYGYDTGRTYSNGCKEMHTYISFYNHWGVWHGGIVLNAVESLKDAYLYTGDPKYGRIGAILVDRIADVYPDMDTKPYVDQLTVGNWYKPHGKVVDSIWENQLAQEWVYSYDAFYPMYDDPQVVSFLSEKASKYKMSNAKTDPSLIRTNCEDGILREIFRSAKIGNIYGNFGMHQSTVSLAAVVLDAMPETREMIDWVFRDGEGIGSPQANEVTGGNVMRQLITSIDRNGVSNEVSPEYSDIWAGGITRVVRVLDGYTGYASRDLYKNPVFIKMLKAMAPLTMSRYSTVQIGDSGATADDSKHLSQNRILPAYANTKDPEFGQILYFANGNKLDGLHYDIFTKNPESLQDDVKRDIEQYGEYQFDKSVNIPGYGFAALRSGSLYQSAMGKPVDTQSTFWMYYGRGAGHGHKDSLNLGIEALGLNIAPELGYPRNTTADDYMNWGQTTVSHNTVMVNDMPQKRMLTGGKPFHFDDSGRVKIMDADAAHQYGIDTYRRTVVNVSVDDENSYAVDFFRVKGGNEHVYSFHALSDTIAETAGLDNIVPQKNEGGDYIGSYAGADVPYATEKIVSGYAWLKNVDRAANVKGGNFMVDFKIKDFRGKYKDPSDLRLRMTMVNGFDLSEVAIADGIPPLRMNNPESLKFVLARRSGTNIDSLFTTVYEPYKNDRYIKNIETVSDIKHADGSAIADGEIVRAVKVTLANERIDYVVYALDNTIEYRIDDMFNIRGFIGVYTESEGREIYSYVNDGDKIGGTTGVGAYTGSVSDFTKDLVMENTLTVSMDSTVDPKTLVGKYIYINHAKSGNAAYEILGARAGDGNKIILDTGDVGFIDNVDGKGGYTYNIEAGQTFRIPMPTVNDTSPVFTGISNQRITAEKLFTYQLSAKSVSGKKLTYTPVSVPSGVTVSPTGLIKWTPSGAQVGFNPLAIMVSDGIMSSTARFTVEVLNSTDGGGGGTGPGPGPGPKPDPDEKPKPDPDEKPKPDPDEKPKPDTQFKDLAGYDWASDAINKLAKDGIIKGVSEDEFAPENDITRADFVILMVRALKLESTATDNFADVGADDYFARELAIAKANGIITGFGDNMFNPRGKITRQDMMTIMARALQKSGYKLDTATQGALDAFADSDDIAEYAREAAALLVKNGIIAGNDGRLNPTANTTRAEVAVLLSRVLYPTK